MVKQQLADIYFSLKPQLSKFGDINVLYTVYILPSVYVQRYTRVHTHTLLRFKRTYKLDTFIVMTGLCSLPDWRGREAFQKEMHRLENLTQHATARLYTQFRTHTEFGVVLRVWSLKKQKKQNKENSGDTSFCQDGKYEVICWRAKSE